uniref:Protein kinase domain-containing protein n=1 Tax=Octactis speculum TaxID=3111310 RepID=A0A7S2DCV2_9STRA
MKHENISTLIEGIECPETVYIIQEFVGEGGGGDMLEYMEAIDYTQAYKNSRYWFQPRVALHIGKQIISAINYLQDNRCIHRDLKPENIVMTKLLPDHWKKTTVKLVDFGCARILKARQKGIIGPAGTPAYAAPEVYKNKLHSFPSDVWSVGVIFFYFWSGELPVNLCEPDNPKFKRQLNLLHEGEFTTSGPDAEAIWSDIPQNMRELIGMCNKISPAARVTAKDALTCFNAATQGI